MAIVDTFEDHSVGLSGPVVGGFDVVADDAVDLSHVTRGLMVTTSGDVAVVMKNGTTLVLPGLVAGVLYPIRASRVLATGTTAAGIKGFV